MTVSYHNDHLYILCTKVRTEEICNINNAEVHQRLKVDVTKFPKHFLKFQNIRQRSFECV